MKRDPNSFTGLMHSVMKALCRTNGPTMVSHIAQEICDMRLSAPVGPIHLAAPINALRKGGWIKQRKVLVDTTFVGSRAYPRFKKLYWLPTESQIAYLQYLRESGIAEAFLPEEEQLASRLQAPPMVHEIASDGAVTRDSCGDLKRQHQEQTLAAIRSIPPAPRRVRVWRSFVRGLASMINIGGR